MKLKIERPPWLPHTLTRWDKFKGSLRATGAVIHIVGLCIWYRSTRPMIVTQLFLLHHRDELMAEIRATALEAKRIAQLSPEAEAQVLARFPTLTDYIQRTGTLH